MNENEEGNDLIEIDNKPYVEEEKENEDENENENEDKNQNENENEENISMKTNTTSNIQYERLIINENDDFMRKSIEQKLFCHLISENKTAIKANVLCT